MAALSGNQVGLYHCCTFGSMLAISFEKFIADKDLCGAVKKPMKPIELSDEGFALEVIKEMRTSGNYLMQTHTLI